MNLFGRKKQEQPKVNPADTIIKLRQTLDTLEKREAHIQKKIEMQLREAKEKGKKKDKTGALFALKRKKMYEKEVQKLQGARMNLEMQIMNLESTQVNMETFSALKQGANQMKAAHSKMSVDMVDETMDDIQEEMANADEISEAISRPVGGELIDDDELLAELDELEAEDLEAEFSQVQLPSTAQAGKAAAAQGTPASGVGAGQAAAASARTAAAAAPFPDLPIAPSTKPTANDVDEEELKALRELEASMAL